MSGIVSRLLYGLQAFERHFLFSIFGRPFPPAEAICVAALNSPNIEKNIKPFSIKDILGDGFLYAVPKHRRPVEKKLNRRFGDPKHIWKLLVPKTNIRVCNTCGHYHEAKTLCAHCYEKVRLETVEMQNKIKEKLGLDPIEQEVIVLYEGEKLEQPEEFWKGKRIIEMEKPRPSWFSKNLLQRTTQQPSTTTDIKPTELA